MIQQREIGSKHAGWRTFPPTGYTRPAPMFKPKDSGASQDPPDPEKIAPETDRRSPGRVLALDLGSVRVGVAVSDELRLAVRPLPALKRTNWKQLVRDVAELCSSFDVTRVVLGLPLRLDGTEGDAAAGARRAARNLGLSLGLPVSLQDERHTSADTERRLRADSLNRAEIARRVDSEAAALILSDYLSGDRLEERGSS